MRGNVNRIERIGCAALVIACVAMAGPEAWAAGVCITARVPAPFTLPSGSVHPAGLLTLCPERRLNPATGLHRILVAGMPVELASGRSGRSELSQLDAPVVLFVRQADGTLRLAGYVSPEGPVVRTHLLRASQKRLQAALPPVRPERERDWVLVAAQGR